MELYNGDCLEILKTIPDKSVDLIICDLPYGCLAGGEKPIKKRFINGVDTGTTLAHTGFGGCAWDVKIDLPAFWEQIKRIRKNPNSPCLHFCTTKFGFELGASNPDEYRYDLVWNKKRGVSFLSANKMPMRSHEMIYVFSKAGAYYNRKDLSGNYTGWGSKEDKNHKHTNIYSTGMPNGWKVNENKGTRCVLSVIEQKSIHGKGRHPTEKPVELYKFLLERYCPPGGTVLDPTFGSGNSGVAAQQLGLKYIGIEKDEAFFKKAKAILLPEPEPEVEIIHL
jgi:site-specific DNA-methyltransferase (adenine-specific)